MAGKPDDETIDKYGLIFNDSFERVLGVKSDKEHFFELFYEIFVKSSPEIAEKFKNTDMELQKSMLRRSLYHMMNFFVTKESGDYLKALGAQHSKSVNDITPKMYELWLDAMIETLRECDPEYSPTVALAWRVVFAPGISYMKFHYDQ